jgi:hypothetical protein
VSTVGSYISVCSLIIIIWIFWERIVSSRSISSRIRVCSIVEWTNISPIEEHTFGQLCIIFKFYANLKNFIFSRQIFSRDREN